MTERIHTHTEVVSRERAAALGKAANALESAYKVNAIAESGEEYTTYNGYRYHLGQDTVGLQISGPGVGPLNDLADRIEKNQRRQMKKNKAA